MSLAPYTFTEQRFTYDCQVEGEVALNNWVLLRLDPVDSGVNFYCVPVSISKSTVKINLHSITAFYALIPYVC